MFSLEKPVDSSNMALTVKALFWVLLYIDSCTGLPASPLNNPLEAVPSKAIRKL